MIIFTSMMLFEVEVDVQRSVLYGGRKPEHWN